MGLFVVFWMLSSLWGHFRRANRETHYQPAPERSAPELSLSFSPVHPHFPLSSASAPCYLWSALGFISAEHLFQWLSLPLLSAAVRVKSRAHQPRLESFVTWSRTGADFSRGQGEVHTGSNTTSDTESRTEQPLDYADGLGILLSHCLPTKDSPLPFFPSPLFCLQI